jgi:hypothetical protein
LIGLLENVLQKEGSVVLTPSPNVFGLQFQNSERLTVAKFAQTLPLQLA